MDQGGHMTPARLREILPLVGYNQTTIAPVVGYSSRTVRRWAAGKKDIPQLVAEKLEAMAKTVKTKKSAA